jgi:hypothetical protein
MFKRILKSSIYLIALTVVSTAGAILINAAVAAWIGPTANPPGNNAENLLFSGSDAALKSLTLTGANLFLIKL